MNSAIEKYYDTDYTEEIAGKEMTYTAKTFSNIKYNQKLVDKYSCTGQAACWVISDVTGYALPLSFRQKVWERQIETWAVEWKGDYLQNWMKQAVKLFNEENPELPYMLKYYRINDLKNSKQLLAILSHSSIQTGYTGALKEDAQDNWIIDNNDNVKWFGHAVRLIKWTKESDLEVKYCDNYEGVNKYTVITIPDFLNNKDFFSGWYYIRKVAK